MSQLTTTQTQLPAHLQHLASHAALMAVNQAAAGGISAGGWPRISIKGSRFRLQSPQGDEVVMPTLDLDVVIVDANPHGLSKVYYQGAYDPSVEEKTPDCWSDNGVGPSNKAAKPQCVTCAACPHNVWGSKINPSGSQTKACSDVKKVAVMIAANPEGPIFELRIPPASLKNFAEYINAMDKRGMPACTVVTKMKFDTNADFPKLTFEAVGWATAEQAEVIGQVIGTEEVNQCTGTNDKPVDPAKVAATVAAVQPVATPVATVGPTPPPNPAFTHATAPFPARTMPPVVLAHSAPVTPLPMAPVASAPGMPAPEAAAKRTRTRKTEKSFAETHMAQAPQPAMNQAPQMPPAPQQSAPATVAPLTAPVTNAALDDMIAGVMNV